MSQVYSGSPLLSSPQQRPPPCQRPPTDAVKCHFLYKSTPHQRSPLLFGHLSAAFEVALLQGDHYIIFSTFQSAVPSPHEHLDEFMFTTELPSRTVTKSAS